MNLSDNLEDELSEEEAEEKSEEVSQISEIPEDSSSDVTSVSHDAALKAKADKAKRRLEKAWHAAKELVDSEQRYVEKLRLLSEVRHIISLF